jgi:membrane protease YdiL (CAAX protease family)
MVWIPKPENAWLAPDALPVALLLKGLLAVILLEALVPPLMAHWPFSKLMALGALRTLETGVLLWLPSISGVGWGAIGLGRGRLTAGSRWGLMGAALFALAALGGGIALHLLGIDPLALIRAPLPSGTGERILFFLVGGAIAPIAEEVLFRGYLYTYCRRWGIFAALILSTAVFVALHLPRGLPLTQIVGGIIFALAYEGSGSLVAAILIHSLGNLAIFSLSLI